MSYQVRVYRLGDDSEQQVRILTRPDECPICRRGCEPVYEKGVQVESDQAELVFRCPRQTCKHLFIAYYVETSRTSQFQLRRCEPTTVQKYNFDDILEEISPAFCKIFNQAVVAEQKGLDDVAGVGYRKALEFLVKDYLIHEYPEDAKAIRGKFLGACIDDHIDDDALRNCAQMAAWLGNDETHYERRWVDKDIEDLKRMINLTEQSILTSRLRRNYEAEMLKEGDDEEARE